MQNIDTTEETEQPPLDSFDPWKLSQPDDGITYLYRSAVDGYWRIINDEDMALQEATNYPVGELVDYEEMGDCDESEAGELRAIFLPPSSTEDSETIKKEIELTERQRERFERIKAECTDGGRLPEPTDSDMFSSLLDTWDAVGDGLYSEVD